MGLKVLIANRGEIACRIARSCRELDVPTVAVYSEADAHALHVELADEAYAIGPASPRESYLRADKILEAAKASGATAIHPGYGFLSERPDFAEQVNKAGLTWIGPSARTIADMGDKQRARDLAMAAGVPVLPGSVRFDDDVLDGIENAAEAVGFPLLVKAASGGGGIGMRRVKDRAQLREAAAATKSMAEKAFGDGTIYLERFVTQARHVEIQVLGFGNGQVIHLYERDCSLQRRFQKVIEESPAPGLPEVVLAEMADAAVSLCRAQNYKSAGTVEFIVDASTFDFYFLEMNTRIQVEHPVTEMNTGLDLVSMQVQLANGTLQSLQQSDVHRHGHAIECRIYAENPSKNFMPSPGRLERFDLPTLSEGIRVDCGYRAGDQITFFYDPMIAKVICHAETRHAAIDRMIVALDCSRVEGLHTNIPFLRAILDHRDFRAGEVFTGFIDTHNQELIKL